MANEQSYLDRVHAVIDGESSIEISDYRAFVPESPNFDPEGFFSSVNVSSVSGKYNRMLNSLIDNLYAADQYLDRLLAGFDPSWFPVQGQVELITTKYRVEKELAVRRQGYRGESLRSDVEEQVTRDFMEKHPWAEEYLFATKD